MLFNTTMEYVETISGGISFIYLIFLSIWHFTHLKSAISISRRSHKKLECTCQSLLGYSFMLLITGLLFITFGIVNSMRFWFDLNMIDFGTKVAYCYLNFHTVLTIYGLFKILTYLALFIRLKNTFDGAPIGVHQVSFCCSKFIFHILWPIYIILSSLIIIVFLMIKVEIKMNADNICEYDMPIIPIISVAINEILMCGINVYLFIKPLFRMSSIDGMIGISLEHSTNRLKYVIKKNALLATISIISTTLVYILIIIFDGDWSITWQKLDIIVTNTCIVCLFTFNQSLFNCMCCCCFGCKRNMKLLLNEQRARASTTRADMLNTSPTPDPDTYHLVINESVNQDDRDDNIKNITVESDEDIPYST